MHFLVEATLHYPAISESEVGYQIRIKISYSNHPKITSNRNYPYRNHQKSGIEK